MRIIFIRHSEPDYINNSLTPKGFKEAELLKDRIINWDVDAFFTSPLERAYLTGKPALEQLNREAEVLEWMREFYFHLKDPVNNQELQSYFQTSIRNSGLRRICCMTEITGSSMRSLIPFLSMNRRYSG